MLIHAARRPSRPERPCRNGLEIESRRGTRPPHPLAASLVLFLLLALAASGPGAAHAGDDAVAPGEPAVNVTGDPLAAPGSAAEPLPAGDAAMKSMPGAIPPEDANPAEAASSGSRLPSPAAPEEDARLRNARLRLDRADAAVIDAEQNFASAMQLDDQIAIQDAQNALDAAHAESEAASQAVQDLSRPAAPDAAAGADAPGAATGSEAQSAATPTSAPLIRTHTRGFSLPDQDKRTTPKSEVVPRATRQGPDDPIEDRATRAWKRHEGVQRGSGNDTEDARDRNEVRTGTLFD